ncbi:MAG: DMT family transporter, partial [Ellagibacter isourolithinifaciens]
AGLLCSLESVFCALFSVAFFGEALTPRMALGFALIFASVVATQLGDKGGSAAAAAATNSAPEESAADGPAATASRESSEPVKRNRGRIAR